MKTNTYKLLEIMADSAGTEQERRLYELMHNSETYELMESGAVPSIFKDTTYPDLVFVWDHGEGPHCPTSELDSQHLHDLWAFVESVLRPDVDRYVVVWLKGGEADKPAATPPQRWTAEDEPAAILEILRTDLLAARQQLEAKTQELRRLEDADGGFGRQLRNYLVACRLEEAHMNNDGSFAAPHWREVTAPWLSHIDFEDLVALCVKPGEWLYAFQNDGETPCYRRVTELVVAATQDDVLHSYGACWKSPEYFKQAIQTMQRWPREDGMPIHNELYQDFVTQVLK